MYVCVCVYAVDFSFTGVYCFIVLLRFRQQTWSIFNCFIILYRFMCLSLDSLRLMMIFVFFSSSIVNSVVGVVVVAVVILTFVFLIVYPSIIYGTGALKRCQQNKLIYGTIALWTLVLNVLVCDEGLLQMFPRIVGKYFPSTGNYDRQYKWTDRWEHWRSQSLPLLPTCDSIDDCDLATGLSGPKSISVRAATATYPLSFNVSLLGTYRLCAIYSVIEKNAWFMGIGSEAMHSCS